MVKEAFGIKPSKPNDVQAPDPVPVPGGGEVKRGIVQALDDESEQLLREAHDLIQYIQVKNPHIEQWLRRARVKLGL